LAEKVRILVVDDELAIRRFLRASLDTEEYELLEAENGAEAIHATATKNPQLILLDLGLPDLDGIEVTRSIREWSKVPIIVLSARGREQDKVATLDSGADDYLTKPFGVGELLARIRVALRHSQSQSLGPSEFVAHGVVVDLVSRRVTRDGLEVRLTPIEYRLLLALIHAAGKVVTHRQLLEEVWGPAYVEETHYVRVYMGQLRQKLEADPSQPKFLTTEPGVGYRLRTD
jgi:two-component system KDP operon response regulator KdpE